MTLNTNYSMEKLKERNEELRTLKGKIHEEYTKLKNVNAINMEKILDLRFNFPQIWESQIQHKVKHSVAIYDDADIIEIQGKIQENNSNLNTLVKIYDEKVERLKNQMGYLNRELTLQKDKTKEQKQFWVKLRRELNLYPNVDDVKDADDEEFIKAWFIANKNMSNTPSSNSKNDHDGDDDKTTEGYSSDADKTTESYSSDENQQCSTEKPLQKNEEKFIRNMCKSINHLRHELEFEECTYDVMKDINGRCKKDVIEFRNKLPKFFQKIKCMDMAVENLDGEDVERLKKKITQVENEVEIKKIKLEEEKTVKAELQAEMALFPRDNITQEE